MRYSTEHTTKIRSSLVNSADRSFRQKGFFGTGIDSICKQVGMTGTALYKHFPSKEDLFKACLNEGLSKTQKFFASAEDADSAGWARKALMQYLNHRHVKDFQNGCPLSTLSEEIPRLSFETQTLFSEHLEAIQEAIAARLTKQPNLAVSERAWALLALCVGGLTLARAVNDAKLRDAILKSCINFGSSPDVPKDPVSNT